MTLRHQVAAVKTMLEHRELYRQARRDFAASVRAAIDAGVTDGTIADELLADSVAHGEVEPLLAIARMARDEDAA